MKRRNNSRKILSDVMIDGHISKLSFHYRDYKKIHSEVKLEKFKTAKIRNYDLEKCKSY